MRSQVFDLNGFNQVVTGLSSGNAVGGILTNSNTTTFSTFTLTSAAGSFAGNITGNLAFVLNNGTETLSGSNSYTGGTTISGGTLQLGASAALPAGMAATVNSTLDLHGFSAAVSSLSGSGTVDTLAAGGSPTLTVDSGFFQGALQNSTGTLALYKTTSGALTLNAASTYAGGTTMNNGTLILGNGGSGSALGSGTLTLNGGTLAGRGWRHDQRPGPGRQHRPYHRPGGRLVLRQYGTLNLNGGLSTNANTTLAFNLNLTTLKRHRRQWRAHLCRRPDQPGQRQLDRSSAATSASAAMIPDAWAIIASSAAAAWAARC